MATNTTKFYITVNGEETPLTNAMMMEKAVAALREVGADPAYIGKAEAHLATMKKPSKAGQVSPTAVKNNADADKLSKVLPNEPFTLDWVATKMGYVNTNGGANTQKAYQVIKLLLANNTVERVAVKGTRAATYQRIKAATAE